MDLIEQEIVKMRDKENQLNEQIGQLMNLLRDKAITKKEYDEKETALKTQIVETAEEIKAKEAKLEMITKEFKDSAGNAYSFCLKSNA